MSSSICTAVSVIKAIVGVASIVEFQELTDDAAANKIVILQKGSWRSRTFQSLTTAREMTWMPKVIIKAPIDVEVGCFIIVLKGIHAFLVDLAGLDCRQ